MGLLAETASGSGAPSQPDATKEAAMGVVVTLVSPSIRVRRTPLLGYCEVTVFPGRNVGDSESRTPPDEWPRSDTFADDKPQHPRKKRAK